MKSEEIQLSYKTNKIETQRNYNHRLIVQITYCLILSFNFLDVALGQQSIKEVDITIGSPAAAEIIKYGNLDVSMYKGVPNVTVPIYNIDLKSFSLPVYLSYDASGVKLDQIASEVGLNWTLMAGGAITSAIYSENDVVFDSDVPDSANFVSFDPEYNSADYEFAYSMFRNSLEGATERKNLKNDIFYYKAGQLNGKFVIDKPLVNNPTALPIPYSNNRIIPLGGIYEGFKILDESGNAYFFTEVEISATERLACSGGLGDSGFSGSVNELIYNDATNYTWHLSKIETVFGDSLNFEYTTFPSFEYLDGETNRMYKYLGGLPTSCPNNPSQHLVCKSEKTITPKLLNKITHTRSQLTIEFTYTNIRTDFGMNFKSLDAVTINKDGEQVENYELTQSYFGSGASQRLRLDEVRQTGYPPYEFTYNLNGDLPQRGSYAQDIWGFYNGQNSNFGLVPNVSGFSSGNDRSTDPLKILYWTLNKVKYPTGGSTIFKLEADPNGGGVRIKTIEDLDGMGNVTNKRTYSYIRHDFFTHDFSDDYNIWIDINGTPYICNYETYSSTSVQIPNVIDTPDYGYTKVMVEFEEGDGGKSEYEFSTGIGRNRLGSGQGDLLQEKHYEKVGSQYNLIQKIENNYDDEDNYSGISSIEDHHTEKYYPQLHIQLESPKYIPPPGSGGSSTKDATFRIDKYNLISSWSYPQSTITTIYDPLDNTKYITNELRYFYSDNVDATFDDKVILRSKTYINSDSTQKTESYIYAFEEYSAMKSLNMISQPYSVELIDPSVSTADSVLSKNWMLWNQFGGKWHPCGTWLWDGTMDNGEPKAPTSCSSN